MSNRIFKSDLSTEGLNGIIEQLRQYADVDLPMMADEFVRRLAEIGIQVAEYAVVGEFKDCIEFKYIPMRMGAGNLTAWDIQPIQRIWYTKGGAVSGEADISPILMSEYGAGPHAIEGHRGTFPGQKYAFRSVWYWYDKNGEKHSSNDDTSMIPTQPMYKALVEMMEKVKTVAKEVFSSYGNG